VHESNNIRVPALQSHALPADGVHGADAIRQRIEVIEQRDDGFFMWNRDVSSKDPVVGTQLSNGTSKASLVNFSKHVAAIDAEGRKRGVLDRRRETARYRVAE
jgi:hypothetical protein